MTVAKSSALAALRAENEALKARLGEMEELQRAVRGGEVDTLAEELRDREQRYRTVADFTYDWEFWTSPDGGFEYLSPSVERILGRRIDPGIRYDELLRRVVHPEDLDRCLAHLRELRDIGPFEMEFRIVRPDGEVRWLHHVCQPIRDGQGTYRGTRGSNRDITGRKQAEAALRASEDKFRSVFANAAIGLAVATPDGRFVDANAAYCEITGYTSQELKALTLGQIVHPEDVAENLNLIADIFAGHSTHFVIENRYVTKASNHVWVRKSVSLVRDAEGEARWLVSLVEDITEQKQAASELLQSEQRFRQMAEAVGDVFWLTSADSQTIHYVSPAFERVWGRKCEALYAHPDLWMQAVLPEDLPKLRDGLARLTEGGHYDLEYRISRPDGEVRWISDRGYPSRDGEGRVAALSGVASDITERKYAAEALRQADAMRAASLYARNLIEASLDPLVMIDASGRITDVNRATEEATGRARDRLIGSDFSDCFTEPERARAGYLKAFAEGLVRDYQLAIANVSGGIVDVLCNGVVYRDENGEVLGVFAARDITERKAAEERLRMLSMAVEQSIESIVITDADGSIEYVNEAFVRNTGYAPDEVLGHNPRFLKSGKTAAETFRAMWEALSQGREWTGELVNRRKNGEEYVEFAVISPIRQEDGRVTHYLAVKEDITEKKAVAMELDRYRQHLETLVKERTLQLAEAKEAAEQASRTKSLFLANMSHEIRTPMNAIMGMTDLCLALDPTERQLNYLTKIKRAADSLLQIIDDILDFSRIEADRLELESQAFLTGEVIDGIVSLLDGKARAKGLRLTFEFGSAPKDALLGDPGRLSQILVNLVGNAIKFSDRGTIHVGVFEESREGVEAVLHFSVRDEGIGVDPAVLPQLFKPFTQADVSTTRRYGGTGLGLAISRRLVEMMGGTIWLDSVPGQGTTFHFTARFGITDALTVPRHRHGLGKEKSELLSQLRGAEILLVEDSELNQEVIGDILGMLGINVRIAGNGEEALRMLETSPLPDCVLMDCQMPLMDGMEATRRLRAMPRCRHLPVIALTANVMAGDRESCLEAGMNDFLGKPVDVAELCATLIRWLRPKAPPAEIPTQPAEMAADAPPLPELPGILAASGLAYAGGRSAFFVKLLTKFRDGQGGNFLKSFRHARQAGDWSTAARLAHTLKGAARTLGAGMVGDLAERLEEASRQGRSRAVAELLPRLERALSQVLGGLDGLDAVPEQTPPPAVEQQRLLDQLDELLAEQDTAAVEYVPALEQMLADLEGEVDAGGIVDAIGRYDFAQAREQLRRLAAALRPRLEGRSPL